jgi:hypothetical protein
MLDEFRIETLHEDHGRSTRDRRFTVSQEPGNPTPTILCRKWAAKKHQRNIDKTFFLRERAGQCKLVTRADQSISSTDKCKRNAVRVRCCKWSKTEMSPLFQEIVCEHARTHMKVMIIHKCTSPPNNKDQAISLLHSLMKQWRRHMTTHLVYNIKTNYQPTTTIKIDESITITKIEVIRRTIDLQLWSRL